MLRERELVAVLAALAEAGVETLLLKGTPLAYTHYPEPALRTRCDTDVLIAAATATRRCARWKRSATVDPMRSAARW